MADGGLLPRLTAMVTVPDGEALRALLSRQLDFGCRPTLIPQPGGGFDVPVIATSTGIEALRADGFQVRVAEPPPKQADVGEGDRFKGETVVPRGFGVKRGSGEGPSAGLR